MWNLRVFVSLLAAGMSLPIPAQETEEGPGRGVARISLLNGDVSIRRGDSGDYIAAVVNAPMVLEDRVLTGVASRTEIQFDWANMLRISANGEVRMAELEYRRYLVQLARGTVTWRVLRNQDAYVEISTPAVSVRPAKKGVYRVSVSADGATTVTVRSGEAEIFTPRGSERLMAGKTMLVRGNPADPEFQTEAAMADDDWDQWNIARDRDLERSRSYDYVSQDIYGAEDLDANGRWVNVNGYGNVWSPNVAADWAPYRNGRWSWIDWYGWSWVSYDSWGWAPYHYGRWFHQGPHGWLWHPGSIGARHHWAPAYVAFFGLGGVGINIGGGWGRVGWVPLAPRETFYPWWGRQYYSGYRSGVFGGNNFTVGNNVNITNVYRNARIHNGSTIVDGEGFRRGRGGSSIRFTETDSQGAFLARGQLPFAPGRESVRLADRDAVVRGPDARAERRFFSSQTPARVDRVPFEEQRQRMEQVTGTTRSFQSAAPAVPAASRSERAGEAARGWRGAGESSGGVSPAAGSPVVPAVERSQRQAESEWHRFGSARVAEGVDSGRSENAPRFGNPARPPAAETPARPPSADGWRRFSDRQSAAPPAPNPAPNPALNDLPRSERWNNAPRSESRNTEQPPEAPRVERPPSAERSGRFSETPRSAAPAGESIRISPPIVRERSAPESNGGQRGGDAGGGRGADSGGARGGDSGGGRGNSGGRSR
ncbi:MAG: FecR domain-containing protein [Bryobacteraceae bacterium]|nr:FecR domain-containing protein [Bryobacteraceae bacterium]